MVEAIILSRLTIRPGDVLVCRTSDYLTTSDMEKLSAKIRDRIHAVTGHIVTVLIVVGDWTVETWPEEEMKRVGWIRDPDFNDR